MDTPTRRALSHLRVCDFTGQLAGAGATKFLAAFGAQVIRIEDPVMQGRWDILRGIPPYKDERRGINMGGAFNNHNVEKLGITLNLRTERGKELLRELVKVSDVVSENFAAGVMQRLGFHYEQLSAIKPDIIYVSNCGFGHTGPYVPFKTWGPIVQAMSGLTFSSGIPDQPPAGWGYSYMDHTGAYYMAMAILLALRHRNVTGEGQWVDLSCTEAATTLNGPTLLDYTVNGRPLRRAGMPDANHSYSPRMAPHNIYEAAGDDNWIAIACRNDDDWHALAGYVGEPLASDSRFATNEGRLKHEVALDALIAAWARPRDHAATAAGLLALGVPATPVRRPQERIDQEPNSEAWGLWPTVKHTEMGDVRVDGIPAHLSRTDWEIARGAPCLGEHNDYVFGEVLGLSAGEIANLRADGVL
ncbi:carnitine dehydratase [bacterium SCGC AG-212-C10]|nr:carnitine dehydratase [bacterium SCGC AG-212-C10]